MGAGSGYCDRFVRFRVLSLLLTGWGQPMNTVFFFPFLLIVVFVVAAMFLLPFWFKPRMQKYLQGRNVNQVYAVLISIFAAILFLIPLMGWLVSILDLLQTTKEFDPVGNSLHDWSFSLYGYLYSFRWSFLVTVMILFATGIYFWQAGRKK